MEKFSRRNIKIKNYNFNYKAKINENNYYNIITFTFSLFF